MSDGVNFQASGSRGNPTPFNQESIIRSRWPFGAILRGTSYKLIAVKWALSPKVSNWRPRSFYIGRDPKNGNFGFTSSTEARHTKGTKCSKHIGK